jgi:hypothetical protein
MTTDSKPSRREPGAVRQAKVRQGLARRLDRIEERTEVLPEIQEQLRALTQLLGIELSRPTRPEQLR